MDYVTKFFDQIHCTYWFYSSENFYSRLDRTLNDSGVTASSSWLCALYSIFTIGSMQPGDQAPGNPETKTSLEYLAMARDMSAAAAEEADMDSVKAFGLLVSTVLKCHSIRPRYLT